jgi:hypothetical protein
MGNQQYRLAIGESASRRSGVWRFWSNPKGDIYVANRCLGGVYKASFHKDGKCQFGFTSEYADNAAERFGRRERHLEKWSLPEIVVVRAIQILIPESELRMSPIDEDKRITWLESPPPNSVGTISLFIASKGLQLSPPSNVPGARIVGRLDTTIRSAWLAYAFTYLDAQLGKLIEFEKARLRSVLANITVPPGIRTSLWDSRNDHDRHVLELACDSDNAG